MKAIFIYFFIQLTMNYVMQFHFVWCQYSFSLWALLWYYLLLWYFSYNFLGFSVHQTLLSFFWTSLFHQFIVCYFCFFQVFAYFSNPRVLDLITFLVPQEFLYYFFLLIVWFGLAIVVDIFISRYYVNFVDIFSDPKILHKNILLCLAQFSA